MATFSPTELINDITNHGNDLTDWELGFVDELESFVAKGWNLSEKQIDKLKKIHEQRVG